MTDDNDQMDTDIETSSISEPRSKTVSWSADTGVASLLKELFSHLKPIKKKPPIQERTNRIYQYMNNPKIKLSPKQNLTNASDSI
jgi:hypothetical protein